MSTASDNNWIPDLQVSEEHHGLLIVDPEPEKIGRLMGRGRCRGRCRLRWKNAVNLGKNQSPNIFIHHIFKYKHVSHHQLILMVDCCRTVHLVFQLWESNRGTETLFGVSPKVFPEPQPKSQSVPGAIQNLGHEKGPIRTEVSEFFSA